VRELTRVASPETENILLTIAPHGSAHHVETVVRHFRRAKEAQELTREQEQQANRALSYHFDDDGSLILKARLPAEAGAVFMRALETSVEEVRSNEPVADENILPRDFRATASRRMVTAVTDVPCGTRSVKSRVRDRSPDLSLIQCAAAINSKSPSTSPSKCFPPFAPRPPRMVEVLGTQEQFPSTTNVTRTDTMSSTGRKWTRHFLSGDRHVVGGETKLGNLVTPCYFRHRLVREGGWDIQVLDDGVFRLLKPDGEAFSDYAPLSGNREELLSFLPITNHHSLARPAQWSGDKMDYGLAVQILLQREKKVGGDSEERGAAAG